ncbi:hypothetical protein [Chryseobacterium sp. T1]
MLENQRVKLKSFLGIKSNNSDFDQRENYWILIGKTGKVIETKNKNFENRVLVIFDDNLDDLNLFNHNPIKNSLWILITDLEIVK